MERSKGRLKEPFGKAGLIVAICALAMAMVGGAYAASKLNSTQKKEVTKIAKKFAGKPGANGANGKDGANGAAGKAGENGTDGTSVTTSTFGGNEHGCSEGGVLIKSASPEVATCNGKKGTNGTTGFTETLPSGKTETGAWSVQISNESGGGGVGSISFSIPLETSLDAHHVVYLDFEENNDSASERTREIEVSPGVKKQVGELCPGNGAAPEAAAGFLCVYAGQGGELVPQNTFGPIVNPTKHLGEENAEGASSTGAIVFLEASSNGVMLGTWAVTAP